LGALKGQGSFNTAWVLFQVENVNDPLADLTTLIEQQTLNQALMDLWLN
jgi:hypothetical protein